MATLSSLAPNAADPSALHIRHRTRHSPADQARAKRQRTEAAMLAGQQLEPGDMEDTEGYPFEMTADLAGAYGEHSDQEHDHTLQVGGGVWPGRMGSTATRGMTTHCR